MPLVAVHSRSLKMDETGSGPVTTTISHELNSKTLLDARIDHIISPFRIAIIAKIAGNSESRCIFVLKDVECIEPFEDYDGDNHYSTIVKEFVRKLLSKGRRISCHVDRFIDPRKVLGTLVVHPNDKTEGDINVNMELIKNGYAMFREFPHFSKRTPPGGKTTPNSVYLSLQEEAKSKKLNFWGLKADEINAMREKARIAEGSLKEFLEKHQGEHLNAYVSKVYNPVCFQLVVPIPSTNPKLVPYYKLRIELSGVCTFPPVDGDNSEKDQCYNAAMCFLEDNILLKDTIFCPNTIRKTASFLNLCGYIQYPGSGDSLSYILLANGYVMLYPKTAELDIKIKELYLNICNNAIINKLGYWKPYYDKHNLTVNIASNNPPFKARVIQVISGVTLLVRESENGTEKRVHLSGLKTPAPTTNSANNSGGLKFHDDGMKARNELIKLVGSDVEVTIDYQYVDPNTNTNLYYGSVYSNALGNVSLHLLTKGFVDVNYSKAHLMRIPPKMALNLERSHRVAASKKLGIYSDTQTKPGTVVDYSTSNKYQEQIAKLFDSSNIYSGIIEAIFSPTRFKVYIQKKQSIVVLNIANVHFPKKSGQSSKFPSNSDNVREEAIDYVRNNFLQRTVLITNINLLEEKRNTNFRIITAEFYFPTQNNRPGEDLAETLLLHGYVLPAHSHSSSDQKLINAHTKATELAKNNKKGLWAARGTINPANENESINTDSGSSTSRKVHLKSAFLTYAHEMDLAPYFQVFSNTAEKEDLEKKLSKLNSCNFIEKNLSLNSKSCEGSICCAKYSVDNCRYRVRITGEGTQPDKFVAFFIDYGNSEEVSSSDIYELPEELNTDSIPPLAVKYHLAYIDDTAPFDEHTLTFLSILTNLSQKSNIKCRMEQNNELKREEIILFYSDNSTINEKLILEGVAPLQNWCLLRNTRGPFLGPEAFEEPHSNSTKPPVTIFNLSPSEMLHRFKSAQEIAKTERRNMWISGDFLDYEPPVKNNRYKPSSRNK